MKPAALLSCLGLCGAASFGACGGLNDVSVQIVTDSEGGNDPGRGEGGSTQKGGSTSQGGNTSQGGDSGAVGGEAAAAAGPGGAGSEGGAPAVVEGPPTVVEVWPETDAADAEPTASIELVFSEPLNEATLNKESFQVLEGDVPVPGKLSFSGVTLTFTPTRRLALLGTYTVKVTTDVEDTTGDALEQPFESTFQVRDGIWSAPRPLTEVAGTFSDGYHLSIDSEGNVLAAWRQTLAGATDISAFARRYLLTEGFEDVPVLETDTAQSVTTTRTAMGRDGSAIVLWHGLGGLPPRIWARRFANGAWEATSATVNTNLPNDFRNLLVAGTEKGRAVVAWLPQVSINPSGYRQSVAVNQAATDGTWPASANGLFAADTYTGQEVHGLDMAFASNGNAMLVFAHKVDGVQRLRYSRFVTQTGTWTTTAAFEGTQPTVAAATPLVRVAMDDDGGAMAIWKTGNGPTVRLVVSRYSLAVGWSNAATIGSTGSGDVALSDRSLVSNGKDYFLGWKQAEGTGSSPYSSLFNGEAGAWTTAELIRGNNMAGVSPLTSPLSVGVDARGNRVAVWSHGVTLENTLYARFDASSATWGETAALVPGDGAYDLPQAVVAANGVAAVLVRRADQPSAAPPQLLVFE